MNVTIDVGGSKTRGFIYDGENTEGFEIEGGFGLATDCEEILDGLFRALQTAFACRADAVRAVAVNLGGKNKTQIQSTVQAVFPHAHVLVQRESEGTLAFRILREQNADILVMAGTGCIVFAKGKRELVVGGWGKDYGDEGSGYFIGSTAVKRALKELDGQADGLSLLTKTLFDRQTPFAFSHVEAYCAARDEVRTKIPKTREGIAALTKTVAACAEQGCALSNDILRENARHIRDLIRLAAKRAQIDKPRVVINGGITRCKALWQSELNEFHDVSYINDGIDNALKHIVEEL